MSGYIGRGTPVAVEDGSVEAADIVSNAITNAKMADDAIGINELSATGTASSSTYLRGDNSWATLTGASLDAGDTFNNPNDISADVTTTLVTTKNHMLIGDITVSGTATWTVAGSGELKII